MTTKTITWRGVMPAITTAFDADLNVDHAFVAKHATWLIDNGCTGLVALGSLGEAATLSVPEKLEILSTIIKALNGRAPVVAGISALSTAEAVHLAQGAAQAGCSGLMVLPPYVYLGDWRENKAHVSAVLKATPLSCMLYNNPVAYTVDYVPEQVKELAAEHPNLNAIKESSADVRRIAALRSIMPKDFSLMVGVDDAILESIYMGASGWVAGLVNAFPRESVDLFNLAQQGEHAKAFELYSWFLPLLRMDTVPKFVQLIKLMQAEVGMGNSRVRAPRLVLEGVELAAARATLTAALGTPVAS
jgi:dihydrodipicolinate synthase/N-acetylneuraminate lyase